MEIKIDSLLAGAKKAEGAVVVVDVYHAFTTTAIAFQQGAERVVLTPEPDEAMLLRKQGRGEICIGDANGKRPEDFDFGDSPHAVSQLDLHNKTIILATRSGTMGVNAAWRADRVYGAALVNVGATARDILRQSPNLVTIVPMGVNGRTRTDEDEIASIYLKNLLLGNQPDRSAMTKLIRSCQTSKRSPVWNESNDPNKDLDIALHVDRVPFAMEVSRRDRLLVASRVEEKEQQPA